jgi:rhodanese-related sulfurtransferase
MDAIMKVDGSPIMEHLKRNLVLAALALCLVGARPAWAISVEDLSERLAAGERIQVVDVRLPLVFERAHIPGAINIPARLVEGKRIPALGEVVVVGDGLDLETARLASESLGRRPGIQSDWLEGGFEAWRERGERFAGSAAAAGRLPRASQGATYVRYADVARAARTNPGLVLVDLRGQLESDAVDPSAAAGRLALERGDFVKVPRVEARRVSAGSDAEAALVARVLRMSRQRTDHVFVLVDDGRGGSERVAQRLRAAGLHRVRVLIGGHHELENEGRAAPRTIESRHETGASGKRPPGQGAAAPGVGGVR